MKRARAFIVLGMHRSGTSALAGFLESAGAVGPKTEMRPTDDNPKGYVESKHVMAFNDALLKRMGSQWDDPFKSERALSNTYRVTAKTYRDALAVLDAEFGQAELIVLKDPRICRMVPFWQKALNKFGAETLPVLAVRNPLEVAKSLSKRDNMPVERSVLLWLRHTLEAEFNTRALDRVVVRYDQLLDDPASVAEQLNSTFALDPSQFRIEERGGSFLAPELHHQKASLQHLSNRPETAEWVLDCFNAMCELSRPDGEQNQALKTLDAVRDAFNAACVSFLPILTQIGNECKASASSVDELTAQLTEFENTNQSLEQKLNGVRSDRDQIRSRSEALAAQLVKSEDTNQSLEQKLNGVRSDRDQIRSRSEALAAQLNEVKAANLDLQQKLTGARADKDRIQWRSEDLSAQLAEAQKSVKALRSIESEFALTRQKQQDLEARLSAREQDLSRAEEDRRVLVSDLAAQKTSTASLGAELTKSHSEVEALKTALFGVRQVLADEQTGTNALQQSVSDLTQALSARADELEALEQALNSAKQIAELKSKELDELRVELTAGSNRADRSKQSAAKAALVSARRAIQVSNLRKVNAKLLDEITGLISNVDAQSALAKSRQDDIDALKAEQRHLRDQVESLKQQCLSSQETNQRFNRLLQSSNTVRRGQSLKQRLSDAAAKRLVTKKGLFRHNFYKQQLLKLGLNVEAAGIGSPRALLSHYLQLGEAIGLKPHPLFDPGWYRDSNLDVRESQQSALFHYARHGSAEHRSPHPLFSHDVFLNSLPETLDKARERLDPIERFVAFGLEELSKPHQLFDVGHYTEKYQDIVQAGENPFLHYLRIGYSEGRSPNPEFDEAWYRKTYGAFIPKGLSALEYHVLDGAVAGHVTNERDARSRDIAEARAAGLKTVLVVAHSASERIFGSERSLLNVLSSIDRNKFRIVLALPNPSVNYVAATQDLVDRTVRSRRVWWTDNSPPVEAEVKFYSDLIEREQVDLVYTNTIMLREPLLAARACGVRSICHVREIIDQDPYLCEVIGSTPDKIVQSVCEMADYIIANSRATATLFAKKNRLFIIPNAIDTDAVKLLAPPEPSAQLTVGMISSNIAKKGILELQRVAELAAEQGLKMRFVAYGPKTPDTQAIERLRVSEGSRSLLTFPGYVKKPSEALANLDVVLVLSQFAESFGRTAVEAMAAQRPVIAYNRGALPEVVVDGETGFLVEPDNARAVVEALKKIESSKGLMRKMGASGQARAEAKFSLKVLNENINAALDSAVRGLNVTSELDLVEDDHQPGQVEQRSRSDREDGEPVTVVVPNYNYADFLPERLHSILRQTHRPKELIFLDDCSSDNSIEVAEKILLEQANKPNAIPYRIVANTENAGVYRQWLKSFQMATTDWVWIAEADDTCDPDFLENLVAKIDDSLNLVYSQSRKIDETGAVVRETYLPHTDDLDKDRWTRDFVENGPQEVLRSLAYRNSIPNTSAAIIRKRAVAGIEDTLTTFRHTGDWLLYAHLMRTGGVAFVSKPLNNFRRHSASVTNTTNSSVDYLIELVRIREFINRNFPILPRHIPYQDKYLNRDYRIEGTEVNSKNAEVLGLLRQAADHVCDRKRFAIITTNNGSHNGGSEMLWQETAIALRQSGHDVIVLIKDWKPTPDIIQSLKTAGVRVVFKESDGLKALLQADPDLTIISIGDQDEGTEYYAALREHDLDYVIVNQLTKEVRFWDIRKNKQKAVKAGYKGARCVFFTSRNNHRVMEDRLGCELSNGDMHFNPYHIDRHDVPPYPSTADGFSVAIPSKLLFIHKGQDLLLEVMRDPVWHDRDITFNFYGAGPDRPKIESAIEELGGQNLALKGRVNDISEIWRDNHALLMPSRMEGLPIMMVSALLSARMCIATDIGGHAEVIRDNVSGYIVPNPSVEELAETLERAYENRHAWEQMGLVGRQDILDFLPEHPVRDFIEKLEKVVSRDQLRDQSALSV